MTIAFAPIPGESYTCDACGVSRVWGICQERVSSARVVVCLTCLGKPSRDKEYDASLYILPSDAVSRPSEEALDALFDF